MDPISLLMFALLAVLIFFMFRNSRKRQQQMQELQSNLRPGAEVMLTSGIFGTIEEIEEGAERATVRLGTTTVEVHRQAIAKVVTPVDLPEETEDLAPDDDPEFSERIAQDSVDPVTDEATFGETDLSAGEADASADESGETPKN